MHSTCLCVAVLESFYTKNLEKVEKIMNIQEYSEKFLHFSSLLKVCFHVNRSSIKYLSIEKTSKNSRNSAYRWGRSGNIRCRILSAFLWCYFFFWKFRKIFLRRILSFIKNLPPRDNCPWQVTIRALSLGQKFQVKNFKPKISRFFEFFKIWKIPWVPRIDI